MPRSRGDSNVSAASSAPDPEGDQELGSMYDYLAKIILLGPSGCGKSCLLHRFLKSEWRVLTSQTIGVEFASKTIRVGTGPSRPRIKLQLWDTAGTERFRAVSRSYYRGAAGAILVYDISSYASFTALGTFLADARALGADHLSVVVAGNKSDVADGGAEEAEGGIDIARHGDARERDLRHTPSSLTTGTSTSASSSYTPFASRHSATLAPQGREVLPSAAARWASAQNVPVAVEVSAYSGEGVEELFVRLASMIVTRIELGEIDPGDPASGIQYGERWDVESVGRGKRAEVGAFRAGGPARRRGGCC